jgi:hypothetical protein
VLEPPIPRSVRFAEAPAAGKTIMRAGRRTPGAVAYRAFARRLAGLPPEEIELPAEPHNEQVDRHVPAEYADAAVPGGDAT